jgi:ADP-heptose:LPS heptosyltransferase
MRKKIAVLRANALGDFIFILPALQALRNKFPESEIVLLGKKMHEIFLKNRPSTIDRVIVIPPYPGVGEPETFTPENNKINDFFAEMQNESFDMAFQMHGGGKNSNRFVKQLGAKL